MTSADWSFADVASDFDTHRDKSIGGYPHLLTKVVRLSPRSIQHDTRVQDVGCSAGTVLGAIHRHNRTARKGVQYDGIDSEPSFEPHWSTLRGPELTLRVADCRDYKYENISFAVALFIVQFLPPKDKVPFLRSLYSGMLPGSGLVIAEKVYAETGRMQDALTFPYYDQKLAHFTADEILDKERSLRGQMTLWTEAELRTNLQLVGFRDLELVWASFPFIAILALK